MPRSLSARDTPAPDPAVLSGPLRTPKPQPCPTFIVIDFGRGLLGVGSAPLQGLVART